MTDQEHELKVMMLVAQAMDGAMFGDYEEAINLLTQAIQLAPKRGDIYHNRGMAYSNLQKWPQSLTDFGRAIVLDPHPTSYEQRGIVYYQMGDRRAARRDWDQALRLNPRRTLALINLGWLCIEEGHYQQAIDFCTRAIASEPTNAKAYENRARAHLEMGNLVQARADMQKARELVESGEDTSRREQHD